MTHLLKTDAREFDLIKNFIKRWELRINDRNFTKGDVLILRKTKFSNSCMKKGRPLLYTGDEIWCRVDYTLKGPKYGLMAGWVIMSITVTAVT